MKMELKLHGLDAAGNVVQTIPGVALPRHDRLSPPEGTAIVISPVDLETLNKAASRFRQAIVAETDVGSFNFGFTLPGGFTSNIPLPRGKMLAWATEVRPFFLEKDPLFFGRLKNLPSLTACTDMHPCLKRHGERWRASAFGGVMNITVGNRTLDLGHVVNTFFNCDFFHSAPQDPTQYSLERLFMDLGGEPQALTVLAIHLNSAMNVVGEFLNDVCAVCPEFRAAVIAASGG